MVVGVFIERQIIGEAFFKDRERKTPSSTRDGVLGVDLDHRCLREALGR